MFEFLKKDKKRRVFCCDCEYQNKNSSLCKKRIGLNLYNHFITYASFTDNKDGKCKHYKPKTERNPSCQTQPTKES